MNADDVDRARAVRIEDEIARRGVKLRRVGAEWIGPCPVDGGTDRFSINTRKQLFNCRGHGGGDVISMVEHIVGCDFIDAVRILVRGGHLASSNRAPPPEARSDDAYVRQQARKAAWLWDHRQPIAGSIAETYLREARGYGGPLPSTLGFLPAGEGRHPAMIAAFAFTFEPEVEPRNVDAVHLTLLASDGRSKAGVQKPKICVGRPAGRPIVLAPINDGLALSITEGIEDGLSVAWPLGMGTWAAGSASYMPALAGAVPAMSSASRSLLMTIQPGNAVREGSPINW
jgi:putative DNA primase/helicase